ncbi:MAG: Ig-like domain-containing protein [Muribaculaceae bacterium]|nr:Ig-like domain-containing protein [Muribaculaceae bacterium]
MRVQIQHTELRPLIKEGYDKVYDAMTRLLAPEEIIFAKWEAGFGGILQWTLPNDYEWRPFTAADNYDKQAIVNEFMRLKEIGEKKLGTNERLKQAVYSIPSEASVYYAVTSDGAYHIMLTAWGYSFPAHAPVTDIKWQLPPESQDTTLRLIEDGKPMVNLPFDIHRSPVVLHHQLDDKGEKYLGKLMPGTQIFIEVPSLSRRLTLTVEPGKSVYTFDMTVARNEIPPVTPPETHSEPEEEAETEEVIRGDRTISVQFIGIDGKPVAARTVTLSQDNGVTTEATTDDKGFIYISESDFATGTTVTTRIVDVPDMPKYTKAAFVIEPEENEYVIVYSERSKSDFWPAILVGVLAVALSALTIWGALKVDL